MIGDVAVPVGGTEAEFTSTDFTAGVSFKICKIIQNCLIRPNLFFFFFLIFLQDVEGDYIVELVFNMGKELENTNGVPYKLEVTNSLGSADYGFQLALSTKPPAGNLKNQWHFNPPMSIDAISRYLWFICCSLNAS